MLDTGLFVLPVFSQLMHAMKKVILTLPRGKKQPHPKPSYHLVDHSVCLAIRVESKVIFHCANLPPTKEFGFKSDCLIGLVRKWELIIDSVIESERWRKRAKKRRERGRKEERGDKRKSDKFTG